jgi:SAM-dependent methyltransferase
VFLDLGCGPTAAEGFEGVDIQPGPGVTYLCDLSEIPWDFRHAGDPWEPIREWGVGWPTDSVDGARCSHLVEHLPDLVAFMRELHRVMKPGALVEIQHPYQFNVRAWQDPTHVRCLNEVSWFYFDKEWRGGAEWGGYGDTDFRLVELDAIPMPDWQKVADEHPDEFEKAAKSLLNVISDLRVVLECRK